MKKIILILFTIFLVIGCTDQPVIGDKYVVTEVSRRGDYGLKYYVRMDCCTRRYQGSTLVGNYHKFYTNKLYTVGDTIKIR